MVRSRPPAVGPARRTFAALGLAGALLRFVGRSVSVRDFAANDLAVERQGLQHDVEAGVVLVREHQAEVEPEVILAGFDL
jgi:hypothetical protein